MTGFKLFLDQRWWEFKDTVTLYHGTSSAFLDRIKSVGLAPPDDKLEEYVERIAKKVFPGGRVPKEYWERIMQSVYVLRRDGDRHKMASVVYLVPSFGEAATYARAYYQLGGEIASDVHTWAKHYCRENNLPEPQPPLSGSRPVVVEVVIPFEWMKTYYDLRRRKERMDRWYADPMSDKGKSYEDYMDRETDFEVRVEQVIPPSMIKRIQEVNLPGRG